MKPFYLTTAIVYANARPHIGFALELMYGDVLARYMRSTGRPVVYVTGTDEHGQKIAQKATAAKQDPQTFVNEVAASVRELCDVLSISQNDFIRTTEDRHARTVEWFWRRVLAAGYIYKKPYKGLYCVGCESFKTEKDLVDGQCPDHQTAPEAVEDENYFFKLSAFQDRLRALFAERSDFVVPQEKFNEMRQLVEGGLEDVSISRSRRYLSWGVPVPDDDEQVVYVWFDALVNYVSAVMGEDGPTDAWPADLHIVGKEINRFHSVLWPAMLMAADLPVPVQIGVHGWITVDGQKMSKTIGNVLDPFVLAQTYGVEPLRYAFLREVPFQGDGDFSDERFWERYNHDLANELGNLLHRAVAMTKRYRDGVVPAVASYATAEVWTAYRNGMESLRFHEALDATWTLVRAMNKHIEDTKPWELAKQGRDKELDEVLYVLLESLRQIAWMLLAFMPTTACTIFERIGTSFESQAQHTLSDAAKWGGLEAGSRVVTGDPLFPKHDAHVADRG